MVLFRESKELPFGASKLLETSGQSSKKRRGMVLPSERRRRRLLEGSPLEGSRLGGAAFATGGLCSWRALHVKWGFFLLLPSVYSVLTLT